MKLLLYIFFAPVLLALLVRFLLPSLDTITLRLAVNAAMPAEIQDQLSLYGRVETFPNREALVARVEKNDDVPGFFWEDGSMEIILQGNEPEGEEVSQIILNEVLNPDQTASFTLTERPLDSQLTEYGLIFAVIMAVMLGAVIESFNMVQDKESGMIRAWAVSPLRMIEMTGARLVFSLLTGAAMTLLTVLIVVGLDVSWGRVIIGFLASAGIAVLVGFILGGFASTQLQMIAIMKVVLMLYSLLPLLSIFIPRGWHILFYPFPNYWMFLIFENIFIGQAGPVGFHLACGITLGVTLIYAAVLFPILRRKLRLK
jgi:ABC-2 type transport system permease protein